MRKLHNYSLILLLLFGLFSCQKDYNTNTYDTSVMQVDIEPQGMKVLGKKLENPYSVRNMKKAYESLINNGGLKTVMFDSTQIVATDLYVRFLPSDALDLKVLLEDLSLEIFDFPLDYEVIDEGVYYHDPTIPFGQITWLYTTVKPDFEFPDVEKEILEECYIPDNDPKKNGTELSSFLTKLEIEAFRITGNLYPGFELNGSKGSPSGTIRVDNNATINGSVVGLEGVRNVKVRVHNFVKWDATYTTTTGNYQISKNFITNVHYAVLFENATGFKIWGNNAFLLPATYNMGWRSNNGHNRDFGTNSIGWLWATVNNGTWIYREVLCPQFGITKPPSELRLWTFRMSGGYLGSAPMARQITMSYSTLTDVLVGYGITWLTGYLALCLPDIFILKDFTNTKEAYGTIFHELAHASHYTKAGKPYWLFYIAGIIGNSVNGDVYGNGTGGNDGYIGVGEMWGYYFEYATVKQHFGSASFNPHTRWFKPGVLDRLVVNYNFTPQQIFNCMPGEVNNHTMLKNKIISNYGQSTQVTEAFSYYGF